VKQKSTVDSFYVGRGIFTMLFGSGNLIFPVKAGVLAGSKIYSAILGFLISGVILPIIGLISMILFEGDYKKFFARIGKIPSFLAVLFCMFIIGPFLVMPRCITVPFDMLSPFFPNISLLHFSIFFSFFAFILAYKESKLLDFLSQYISWIKIFSLGFIIIAGIIYGETMIYQPLSSKTIFFDQIFNGFQTLDLIGTLFFAYIIIRLIKIDTNNQDLSSKKLAVVCLKGGVIAGTFMAFFYIGFSLLGAYYAHLVTPTMNGAEIFRIITLKVVGAQGIIILILAVLMACFSTLVALSTVFAEYFRQEICFNKISYANSLFIGLVIATIISNFGLSNILQWSSPIINFGYPIIVTITLCNAAYKIFGIETIKIPVLITTLVMIYTQILPYFFY